MTMTLSVMLIILAFIAAALSGFFSWIAVRNSVSVRRGNDLNDD